MTKIELSKCETLCVAAIRSIEESKDRFKKHETEANNNDNISTVHLRWADNKQGVAEGINQVLATLGYKSENMTKLSKLI